MKNILKYFIIPLLIIGLFYRSLCVYFVQDDYWLLAVSQAKNLQEMLTFFLPRIDTVWYRPLSSQIFFFIGHNFFGLNPFFFHIVVIATHLLTVSTLYVLVNKIVNNGKTALLAALLYGVHQIHTVSLSWLATYSFVLGPLFFLLILLEYLHKKYFPMIVYFILGLLTTEVTLVIPLILVSWELMQKNKRILPNSVYLLLISGLLLIMRFIIFPTTQKTNLYHFGLSLSFFTNLKFYLLRILGIPLTIKLLPNNIKWFSLTSALLPGLLIVYSLWQQHQSNKLNNNKFWLWLIIGFWGILPFLLLPNHLAPYYLSFSLLGFAPLFSQLIVVLIGKISVRYQMISILLVVCVFLLQQYIGITWTYQTHWIFKRARLAKTLVDEKRLTHAVGTEAYFALGANSAEKVFK